MKTNLSEIFPELCDGWQVHDNGNYHKTLENGVFELYIAPCKENSANIEFRAEIGLYSKSHSRIQKDSNEDLSGIWQSFCYIRQFRMRNVQTVGICLSLILTTLSIMLNLQDIR